MSARPSKLKVGVIGKDGRTSAITQLLESSPRVDGRVILLSSGKGPSAVEEAVRAARQHRPDFVVIGPEEPLAFGVVDELQSKLGVPCVGPTKSLARLESSKTFTRQLLSKYGIAGNPEHRIFTAIDDIEPYLHQLGEFVIKPDGLTGGKGVKVSGDHLQSVSDGIEYCREIFQAKHHRIVVEEKLEGEEFSLQSFCDGSHVADMVVVQDHKRAYEGDTGPNTGGMGSYTCADHLLPFINSHVLDAASTINAQIAHALLLETGEKYKGILFGGFMTTRNGVKLLEYNARFGDPEALNVLSLLETDLCEIFEAIIDERLDRVPVVFKHQATVCRYIVPNGYPMNPISGEKLENIPLSSDNLRVYDASVDRRPDGVWMTGSRAVAVVGIGKDLDEANSIAEAAAASVKGPAFYRKDIGTRELVERRVKHMRDVMTRDAESPSEDGRTIAIGESIRVG
jgi:phosphoribosylamine--glycine ligase